MTALESFYEVFLALRTALKAKGVPAEIAYGVNQVPDKIGSTRIEFGRDYESGDQVGSARSQHVNPRQPAMRALGGRLRILARSTKPGAGRGDHEQIADRIFDQVYVELHKIVTAAKTLWRVQRAGFLTDPTPDGWNAVVYEVRFSIDSGVADVKWTGEPADELTMAADTTSTTQTATGPGPSTDLPTATTRVP